MNELASILWSKKRKKVAKLESQGGEIAEAKTTVQCDSCRATLNNTKDPDEKKEKIMNKNLGHTS